jgi:hypothetical protein
MPLFPNPDKNVLGQLIQNLRRGLKKQYITLDEWIAGLVKDLKCLPVPLGYLRQQLFFIMYTFKRHGKSAWGLRLKMVSLIPEGISIRQKEIIVHHGGGYKVTGQVE